MNYRLLLRLMSRLLKKTNFFDLILDNTIKQGALYQQLKNIPSIQKELAKVRGTLKAQFTQSDFLKYIINSPGDLAKSLANLSPQDLTKLSEAIAQARKESGTIDEQTGTEAQALSSSWLIYGEYTPIDKKTGKITITTIQGKSYSFPQPIKYSTWERMKWAQGRNGTGAGQIFWDEYWHKIRGTAPKPGVATLFKLLELRKRKAQANKVVKLSKKEARKRGYKKWL